MALFCLFYSVTHNEFCIYIKLMHKHAIWCLFYSVTHDELCNLTSYIFSKNFQEFTYFLTHVCLTHSVAHHVCFVVLHVLVKWNESDISDYGSTSLVWLICPWNTRFFMAVTQLLLLLAISQLVCDILECFVSHISLRSKGPWNQPLSRPIFQSHK